MHRTAIFLFTIVAGAGVEAPIAGCFVEGGTAREVLGIGGNFVLRDVDSCPEVASEWTIEAEADGSWLIKRDAVSGAVEHRGKLRDGRFLVWPDGRLVDLDQLDLPGELKTARLMSSNWFRLVLDDGAQVALARSGRWFFLPGVSR